jgi:hypothetical protein
MPEIIFVPQLMRPKDVARLLDLTIQTVRRMALRGEIPGTMWFEKGRLRFDMDQVQRFIEVERRTIPVKAKTPARKSRFGNTQAGKGVPKALRFNRNSLGPLARYKAPRAGLEDDCYDKHPTGNWKTIEDVRVEVDRSTDTYQVNIPVSVSNEGTFQFLSLLEATHTLRHTGYPENDGNILSGGLDSPPHQAGELTTKIKQICA